MDSSNWQTQLSTIRERNEYAFNKSLFCDIEFSVVDSNGVKVTVPANKYVLAISSPVFEAMFYGQLAESKSTIDLPDCTKEGLEEMLRYVYSDKVKLTEKTLVEVLYLADKYMMPFLKEKCKDYIDPDNVLAVLSIVQKMSDEDLQKHLWNIVDNETHETLSSKPFLKVSRDLLCQILVRDSLNINELDLFHAVDRWVGERIKKRGLESNGETKRSILGKKVIRLIRFPLMMQKEFAEVVLPCEILKKCEMMELFQSINNISPPTEMFSRERRHVGCRLIPSSRFSDIGFDDYHTATIDFTTNKTVHLVGVRMFRQEGSDHNVALSVYKKDERLSYCPWTSYRSTEIWEFEDESCYDIYDVNLDKPLNLDPGVVYTINAEIDGPQSPYTCSYPKNVVTVNDITITYKTSRRKNTAKGCQIPTLILQHMHVSES